MISEHRTYLGDSIYVAIENGMLKLTTENGMGANNTIYIEQEVYEALIEYVNNLQRRNAGRGEGQ